MRLFLECMLGGVVVDPRNEKGKSAEHSGIEEATPSKSSLEESYKTEEKKVNEKKTHQINLNN